MATPGKLAPQKRPDAPPPSTAAADQPPDDPRDGLGSPGSPLPVPAPPRSAPPPGPELAVLSASSSRKHDQDDPQTASQHSRAAQAQLPNPSPSASQDRLGDVGRGSEAALRTTRVMVKVEALLAYLGNVKSKFADQVDVYNHFLDTFNEYMAGSMNLLELIHRVAGLFRGHNDLILGFNTFLPSGYELQVTENSSTGELSAGCTEPEGVSVVTTDDHARPSAPKSAEPTTAALLPVCASSAKRSTSAGGLDEPIDSKSASSPRLQYPAHGPPISGTPHGPVLAALSAPNSQKYYQDDPEKNSQNSRAAQAQSSNPSPSAWQNRGGDGGDGNEAALHTPRLMVKVDALLAYLENVKSRFADQVDVYNQFLDIFNEYMAGSMKLPQLIYSVVCLFRGHNDLILGFNTFLPSGYKMQVTENRATGELSAGCTGPEGVSVVTTDGQARPSAPKPTDVTTAAQRTARTPSPKHAVSAGSLDKQNDSKEAGAPPDPAH